jgi:TRAP-type C4-dicarboxylate transport system permease small subunit
VRLLKSFASHVEEICAGTLLVLMSLATFANVIARYFFNHPLEWGEEFSRYSFIWVVFLGAAYCTKANRHITIDGLMLAVPDAVRAYLAIVADLIILGMTGVLVYYGWVLTVFTTQPTSTLHVPMSVVYVIVPISAALIGCRCLATVFRRVHALVTGGPQPS